MRSKVRHAFIAQVPSCPSLISRNHYWPSGETGTADDEADRVVLFSFHIKRDVYVFRPAKRAQPQRPVEAPSARQRFLAHSVLMNTYACQPSSVRFSVNPCAATISERSVRFGCLQAKDFYFACLTRTAPTCDPAMNVPRISYRLRKLAGAYQCSDLFHEA